LLSTCFHYCIRFHSHSVLTASLGRRQSATDHKRGAML
jgi:hypothetical protein